VSAAARPAAAVSSAAAAARTASADTPHAPAPHAALAAAGWARAFHTLDCTTVPSARRLCRPLRHTSAGRHTRRTRGRTTTALQLHCRASPPTPLHCCCTLLPLCPLLPLLLPLRPHPGAPVHCRPLALLVCMQSPPTAPLLAGTRCGAIARRSRAGRSTASSPASPCSITRSTYNHPPETQQTHVQPAAHRWRRLGSVLLSPLCRLHASALPRATPDR
jgi:hypothetical protein